jgi:hypothetical protein
LGRKRGSSPSLAIADRRDIGAVIQDLATAKAALSRADELDLPTLEL